MAWVERRDWIARDENVAVSEGVFAAAGVGVSEEDLALDRRVGVGGVRALYWQGGYVHRGALLAKLIAAVYVEPDAARDEKHDTDAGNRKSGAGVDTDLTMALSVEDDARVSRL